MIIITVLILVWLFSNQSRHQNLNQLEGFQLPIPPEPQPVGQGWADQFPHSAPGNLSWEFTSPKSNIKNFNETTEITQDRNVLQPSNSSLIGLNQPLPLWIYPYHYLNRAFDKILLNLTIQIEKDHNNNHILSETNHAEWSAHFPYKETKWELLPDQAQYIILDVVKELNRRFNMGPPIVNFRRRRIQYYWVNNKELIMTIYVYKTYTASDIRYQEDLLNPGLNDHLKDNFERKLLIYADKVDIGGGEPRYHLKYLRFPDLEYDKSNPLDDIRYIKQFDDIDSIKHSDAMGSTKPASGATFYVGRSKDPLYRMLANTEARDLYIDRLQSKKDVAKYKCFSKTPQGIKSITRTDDRTSCDMANGLWEKKCEKDSDCPYYQANTNYPNKFGGCDRSTGYCQFPIGVEALTYRKPREELKAYCYNCEDGSLGKSTLGQCCEAQKNRKTYVGLQSPDYAFVKDRDLRFYYRNMFDRYRVNWSKYN
jgi:hypothetical protein